MTMRIMLEEYDPRLKGIRLVGGEWFHASLLPANVYSIGNRNITLVDAGDECDSDALISMFQKFNFNIENVTNVVITHSHDDHWRGLTKLLKMLSLHVLVYKDDIAYYQREFSSLIGAKEYEIIGLKDGDVVEAEGHRLIVVHTPGHDKGSICLFDEDCNILFSGDTIFSSGTTGSLISGNIDDLKRSLKRLAAMNVDIILPGHGDVALGRASEAIRLALERITWNEHVPDDAPYWMRTPFWKKAR